MSKTRNRQHVPTRKQIREQRKQENQALSDMQKKRKSSAIPVPAGSPEGYARCECGDWIDPEIGCDFCESMGDLYAGYYDDDEAGWW